ncbi:MAG: site-specific integrase [Ignavibacteriaceae bacterium]|nr:site-specific integrase [Ignavibacteriaceae bacterium]
MFLSKRPNGFYYIYFSSASGNRISISTKCKLKSDALKFLSNFTEEVKFRQKDSTIPITLPDFFFEYLKYSESIHSKNTVLSIKSCINSMENHFSKIPISELSEIKLMEYYRQRSKVVSSFVIRREQIYFQSICKWAMKRNYLKENLLQGIKKPKLPEKQPLFFSEAEFQILLNATTDKDLRDLFIIGVNTGLRQMELLTLTWNQISFKDKIILLDNQQHITKSKKAASVPLNLKCLQVLTERELNKKSEYVFTYEGEPIKQQFISHKFKKIIRAAKLSDSFSFHTLRHTFASWLVQRNVPIQQVQQLLRHSDLKTSLIYAHLRNDNLSTSVNLLN